MQQGPQPSPGASQPILARTLRLVMGSRKVVQFRDLDYILHHGESLPQHNHTIQSIQSKGTLTFFGVLGLYVAATLGFQMLFPKFMGGMNARRTMLDLILGLVATGLAVRFSLDAINDDVKKIKRDLVLSHDRSYLSAIAETERTFKIPEKHQLSSILGFEEYEQWARKKHRAGEALL